MLYCSIITVANIVNRKGSPMNHETGTKSTACENMGPVKEHTGLQAENAAWINTHRGLLLCVLITWLFFAWVIGNTPYGLDDWRWGISGGFEDFITGSQNGRYVGNLFEIIVTRSEVLKVILIATMATLLPLLSVSLVHSMFRLSWPEPDDQKMLTRIFLAAAMMYLTIPREVWRQTYGWIAGFSNFGFSGVLLLLFQKHLFAAQRNEPTTFRNLALAALSAFCASLILENITVYLAVITLCSLALYLVRNKRCNVYLFALLFGCLAGAALMFSGSIYGALFSTGRAWNNMRSLTVDLNSGILTIIKTLYMRFVYFFPHQIWGDQWVPCALTSILLAVKCSHSHWKGGRLFAAGFLAFALYFVAVRFFGPIENHLDRWSDVLTQRLNLLFFWFVLLAVVIFWKKNGGRRDLLLFLWLSVPAIVVPLLATNTTGQAARCLLTPAVVLIEFCLVLIADTAHLLNSGVKKGLIGLMALLLVASAGEKLVVSYANGRLMRERAELVRIAREGTADKLEFPDFPYLEYLWVTEPLGERQIEYFREFYQIPDGVEITFNTGNLEDYDFYEHIRS